MNEESVIKQETTIKSVLYKNLMESYLPFPLDKRAATRWAESLHIPKGGSTILYTSYMYQMATVFKSYEKYIPTFGAFGSSKLLASIGAKLIKPSDDDVYRSNSILKNIYTMVSKVFPDIGYLYDEEPYSGSLLYELGFLDEFSEYGHKLLDFFRGKGIGNIITVDPHTTNTLTNLKRYVNFDIPFTPYLNIVKNVNGTGKFVMHDSCLYARFLNMYGSIRELAVGSGIEIVESEYVTGKGTGFCCGAPLGPIDDKLSDTIAKARMDSLKSVNEDVLVACPLCYANLSRYGKVKDIAEVIH
ncbi:MAG: (Fe-S)-binding protein [Thermoplasmatales archaeon]|nr:(Fe-S)-binding protein [Thermoplasmatales archaeon]